MQEPQKPKRKRGTKYSGESKTKPKGSEPTERQRETMFGGVRGNVPGQTSESRKAAIRAAEASSVALADFAEAFKDEITRARKLGANQEVISMMTNNALNALKYSIDREFGKAGETIDIKSSDGSMSPQQSHADAVLEALKRKHDPEA